MDDRIQLYTDSKWEPVVGYCRALRVGNRVLVSGTTASTPSGVIGGDDIGAQTTEILRRIDEVLQRAGAHLEHVISTRIYVTDISRWEEVGRAHGDVFGHIRPTTTMVEVSGLVDPALLVEIEAEALVP
ncbi:RidA family protein [Williamsia sp. D3]|uniref:RidA family protein n=1 Tax=Williamsia sp. D3 TaxID=1313067 RepID=UPI0003D31062|nr:RidA family protein [Williamsia sp. D3]ETD33277.1 endoribonuclease L-PSP [Williamsia sp. D3]